MSMFRDMAVAGQTATAPYEEEQCQNLRTGKQFAAKIEPISDLVLAEDLGVDPSAAFFISVRRELCVDMQGLDVIKTPDTKLQLLPKIDPDNGIGIHRKYLAQRVTKLHPA